MSKKHGGSNHAELCPLCLRKLANRLAATSHFRAHVRKGELGELGGYFRTPSGVWFERGVPNTVGDPEKQVRQWQSHRRSVLRIGIWNRLEERWQAKQSPVNPLVQMATAAEALGLEADSPDISAHFEEETDETRRSD